VSVSILKPTYIAKPATTNLLFVGEYGKDRTDLWTAFPRDCGLTYECADPDEMGLVVIPVSDGLCGADSAFMLSDTDDNFLDLLFCFRSATAIL